MLLIIISNTVGTESLHIYLHSENMVCLHVGVIGVCNLCVHTRHEVILTKYWALEQFLLHVRIEQSEIDTKILPAVAIVNLVWNVEVWNFLCWFQMELFVKKY